MRCMQTQKIGSKPYGFSRFLFIQRQLCINNDDKDGPLSHGKGEFLYCLLCRLLRYWLGETPVCCRNAR